jgi:IS5 family transposase
MREAAVNVAVRWFAGFGLTERLPDHSSLTRIRQRWGAEGFRSILARSVAACVSAGIAKGEVVHFDASLIRADVSFEVLARRWVESVEAENESLGEGEHEAVPGVSKTGKIKKVCLTDPEASMATSSRTRRLEPAYKQHTAVCDKAGVIVDVEVTRASETKAVSLCPLLQEPRR